MNRRILTRPFPILLGGGLLLWPLAPAVCEGGPVLAHGSISGDIHEADQPPGEAQSELDKFEADYSGQTGPSNDARVKQPAVGPKVREILRKAGLLYYRRRYAEALASLKPAEDLAPSSDEVLNARAAILSESGDIAGAREIYRQLVEAHPKAFIPNYDLAELLLMEKKYGEARQGFLDLLRQFPNCDLARFKILLTYLGQRNNDEAGAWVAQLKQRGPSAIADYASAAFAFAAGDIAAGRGWIHAAETDFGEGRHRVLYESLADMGFVVQGEYPPGN